MNTRILLVLSTLFLASCTSPTPALFPTPTLTATSLPATATSLPTLVLSVIEGLAPTNTPQPPPTPRDAPALRFPAGGLIHDLHWSPDGSQLAIAAGTNIHIYDVSPSTGSGQALVELHTLALDVWTERIAFHPSQALLGAAAKDGTIHFWNTTTGVETCRFTAHKKGANSLAFQPGGTLLVTTGAEIISRLWDISSALKGVTGGCDVKAGAFLIGSSYTAPDVAFSADGQMFALVDIKNVYLRDSQTRKLIAMLKSDLAVFDIALSLDGRWLAAAQNNATVTLWDLAAKPRPSATILQIAAGKPQTYTWRADFSSDSALLAGATSDGALLVWQLPGLQPVFSRSFSDAVSGLAFKPNTHLLTVGALDGAVYIDSLVE